MISNLGKLSLVAGFGSLGIIGFKRGVHSYKYELEEWNKRFDKKKEFFYSESIKEGFLGSCVYMAPILWLPVLSNEIYRLEVNFRNLEEEKKSDRFNKLLY